MKKIILTIVTAFIAQSAFAGVPTIVMPGQQPTGLPEGEPSIVQQSTTTVEVVGAEYTYDSESHSILAFAGYGVDCFRDGVMETELVKKGDLNVLVTVFSMTTKSLPSPPAVVCPGFFRNHRQLIKLDDNVSIDDVIALKSEIRIK